MRLINSQDVSVIQRVLITLVLRLIMNDGFSFDSSIALFSLVSSSSTSEAPTRRSTKR